jgi:hypothetical protein
MKKIILITVTFLSWLDLTGQSNAEPQILVLSPANVKFDKVFKKEIASWNKLLKDNDRYAEQQNVLNSPEFQNEPANIKEMMISEAMFLKNIDFVKQTSLICEQFLAYRFFEKFPNLLILLKDIQSTGSVRDLKRISEEAKLQYILNFPSVTFYKDNGISYAKIGVQLYDHTTNSLLIDTAYTGDWFNPGFEFTCRDSTLSCTINNALAPALDNVIYSIAINSPTLKKERQLRQERLQVLRNTYYAKPFDEGFVEKIIPAIDSNIVLGSIYQLLISPDETKFVGFFLEEKSKQSFKQLNENKRDMNIKVLQDRDLRDTGYFDNIPQTYAYIVKAVKHENKWYYQKAEVTYFEPEDDQEGRLEYFDNLQKWGFFKDNSTDPNPDFWETNLFRKVKDLRKDPEWDKYGKTIWKREEEENRNYVGLYELVADQLKSKTIAEPKRISIH